MLCVHCRWRIYWNDNLLGWYHENGEEQCRVTFATPAETDVTCYCGHHREFHALREDVYPCFAGDCECVDFVPDKRGNND